MAASGRDDLLQHNDEVTKFLYFPCVKSLPIERDVFYWRLSMSTAPKASSDVKIIT